MILEGQPEDPRITMLANSPALSAGCKGPYVSSNILPRGSWHLSNDDVKAALSNNVFEEATYTAKERRLGWRCAFFLNLSLIHI